MHRREARIQKREVWNEAGRDCQAKQGLWSSDKGVSPLGEQKSRGRKINAKTCARGAGWVGGKLSSPNAPKAEIHGLPDPPSQLSVEEEEERKRERLVPETVHQGGRSHSPMCSL